MDREASAILLTRGSAAALEVYLVERAPQLRFFGGYWALPGGVREAGEDLRQCAVRELREETAVAVAESALTSVCRIRTPPFAPVRYDTEFFLVPLPADAEPRVEPGELLAGRFYRPADALAAWRRGELLLVPPVILLLELLASHDLPGFLAATERMVSGLAAGELHRVHFTPGVILAALETKTLPPATTTNCLIVGEERLLVVDPGTPYPREHDRLLALLGALRAEGRALEAVLLTHHHPDHASGAEAISAALRLPVRGHPLTLARLELSNPGPPLHDGDRLELGRAPDGTPGWQLFALHTPGHDRGHLCFRESRYQALLAGDMLSTVSTIVIDPPEGHMATYLQSLERLLREPIRTVYPAHGPAARDGPALVRGYLAHRRERQQKIAGALRRGPGTIGELLPVVYADVEAAMHPVAARSLLAGLELLAEQGQAREGAGRWELV